MTFLEQLNDCKNPTIKCIGEYLKSREDLSEKLENPKKSLDEMYKYIIGEASKQCAETCVAIEGDTVFGWAVHYYDEDKVEINRVYSQSIENKIKDKQPILNGKSVDTIAQEVIVKKIRSNKKDKTCEGQQSLFGDLI